MDTLVTNVASAVFMFPIALALAGELGLSFMPFAITVMVGASCSFISPMGYQTNLMVHGPGGYKFTDYVRVGVPLTIIVGIITIILTPMFFGFQAPLKKKGIRSARPRKKSPVPPWLWKGESSVFITPSEVDYLAVINGKIFPIEVKSGSSGRLKSMHLCLHNYPNCRKGLVFSTRLYNDLPEQNITFTPLYFAFSATCAG